MSRADVIIVGAGAAGLAAAIFTREVDPGLTVELLDGAARPGAKILVSGGSRCNVTNTVVTERDYNGGRPALIRRVLAGLPVPRTIAFFERIGVRLKEEPLGKLFPTTDRSRDVLDSLLSAARAVGVTMSPSTRVHDVARDGGGFRVETARGPRRARVVVLATGGLSLPKTGSDGAGYAFARRLGHSIVATTPALVPLLLGDGSFHAGVSGVSQEVELSLHRGGRVAQRIRGSMLWTHFGISGPAALDVSRHWLRAVAEEQGPTVTLSAAPGAAFEQLDARLVALARAQPRSTLHAAVQGLLPASVAAALLDRLRLDGARRLAELPREERRAVVHALIALPLPITDSRGYNYAEVTAGGVSLEEVDAATMQSRRCPGLFLVGEVLDVDGRLGGFNFQWAWSSGRVAAEGTARILRA